MMKYGLYSTNKVIVPLQRMLNEKLKLNLKADGNIGKITQSAIANYQEILGISEVDDNGVCYGEKTQAACKPFIEHKYIKKSDFVDAGVSLGIETEIVEAFAKTESKEFGFLDSGFPVILFERHKFYQAISKKLGVSKANKYSAVNSNICNRIPGGYLGGQKEVNKLLTACEIDEESALASASWGLFQIMGSNYSTSGYDSVEEFVKGMKETESNHLKAVVGFIKGWPVLHKATRVKDWTTMARLYNGPAYASHNPPYDTRLKNNYQLALINK